MSDEQKEEKKKIVASQRIEPCGCKITEYSDGTEERMPCMGHAFIHVANSLGQAAQGMAAIGQGLLQQQSATNIGDAMRGIQGIVR